MAYVHSIATSSIFSINNAVPSQFADSEELVALALGAFLRALPELAEDLEVSWGEMDYREVAQVTEQAFQHQIDLCRLFGVSEEVIQEAQTCFQDALEVMESSYSNGCYNRQKHEEEQYLLEQEHAIWTSAFREAQEQGFQVQFGHMAPWDYADLIEAGCTPEEAIASLMVKHESSEAVTEDDLELLPYEEARALAQQQAKADQETRKGDLAADLAEKVEIPFTDTPEQVVEKWEGYYLHAFQEGATHEQASAYADACMRGECPVLPCLTVDAGPVELFAPHYEADRTYGYYTTEELEEGRLSGLGKSEEAHALDCISIWYSGLLWDELGEANRSQLQEVIRKATKALWR